MSRALYHLSYGTSCAGVRLTSGLGFRLELALLDSVLGDRSNQRPSGYEPDELPLLHSAIGLYRRSGIPPGPPAQCFGVGVGLG